jgi:hypothetical protein
MRHDRLLEKQRPASLSGPHCLALDMAVFDFDPDGTYAQLIVSVLCDAGLCGSSSA